MVVAALIALAALLTSGCVKKPYPAQRPVVEAVRLEHADSIDQEALLSGLATAGSPRFLGIWDGVVYDYELYDESVLRHDLERIERQYRRRGFYEARVTAARVVRTDEHHVRVYVRVAEGERALIRGISIPDLGALPMDAGDAGQSPAFLALKAATTHLQEGRPFDEDAFEEAKRTIAATIADLGYAYVEVTGKAKVDLLTHRVDISFTVKPGLRAQFGKLTISGLGEIPEDKVRASLDLHEGRRYSRSALRDAHDALIELGVFAQVEVVEDTSHPEQPLVPITVRVTESALRSVKLGGGTRIDQVRFSNQLILGWEDRNFLGGMRRFTIDARPGVSWFPTRIPGGTPGDDTILAPTRPLPDNSLRLGLRQPAFLEGRTTGLVNAQYNVYPLLYPAMGEDELVIGYNELKSSVGLERSWWRGRLHLTPSFNVQANFPFVYPGGTTEAMPPGLERVMVDYPEFAAALDLRDDRVRPRLGLYLANSFQVAGTLFGGDVSDLRVQPELRVYYPLGRRVTLAARGTLGLLFPWDYGETLGESNFSVSSPARTRDQHKLLFRAFYSGGPNSNRGYPYRGVGPHGPLGFLVPSSVRCDAQVEHPPRECLRPLGGLSLWEASLEVRAQVVGALDLVAFLDASDVARQVSEFNRLAPHLSPGLGLRYATPIGPLRLDIGYRLPGLQVIGRDYETRVPAGVVGQDPAFPNFGNAGTIYGAPIAWHVAIGEAY